jgi:hypothetical protein
MILINAGELAKSFSKYKDEAQREPIAITNNGLLGGYFISTQDYQEFQRVRNRMRKAYTIETMPEDLVQEIANSKMDPEFDHLNDIMKEE